MINPITDITLYIPQRPPFVMVDDLRWCSEEGAASGFRVRQDNIFVENGLLREPALVENIAQTAAARMGYICKQESRPVPVGFIGAVQKLKIDRLPALDDVLETTITVKNQVFNATIIEGKIAVNDQLVASCEMKIFISA